MKNYTCLNHGECQWADETPPREFPLVDGELYCPNCESTNIREAIPEQHKLKRFLPFVAGAVLLLGLVWLLWPKENSAGIPPVQPQIDTTARIDTSKRTIDSVLVARVDSTNATTSQNDRPADTQPRKVSPVLTWTMVEGSGFCDPSLDGTYFYSERNNLGQIRERKVLNKAGCYPASN